MAIQFPEELIYGIPEIDEQHKKLYDMYNEFTDAVYDGRGKDGLLQQFDCLEDFTAYHFRFEERLIEKSNYPNAELHLLEHAQTIAALKQFKIIINTGLVTKELVLSIKRCLIRILILHEKNCDVSLLRHLQGPKEEHKSASDIYNTDNVCKKIGEVLIDSKSISPEILEKALNIQKGGVKKLGVVLVEMGAVEAEDVVVAFAIQKGLLKSNLIIDICS